MIWRDHTMSKSKDISQPSETWMQQKMLMIFVKDRYRSFWMLQWVQLGTQTGVPCKIFDRENQKNSITNTTKNIIVGPRTTFRVLRGDLKFVSMHSLHRTPPQKKNQRKTGKNIVCSVQTLWVSIYTPCLGKEWYCTSSQKHHTNSEVWK